MLDMNTRFVKRGLVLDTGKKGDVKESFTKLKWLYNVVKRTVVFNALVHSCLALESCNLSGTNTSVSRKRKLLKIINGAKEEVKIKVREQVTVLIRCFPLAYTITLETAAPKHTVSISIDKQCAFKVVADELRDEQVDMLRRALDKCCSIVVFASKWRDYASMQRQ